MPTGPSETAAAGRCSVTVNDECRTIRFGTTIASLMAELGLGERRGLAIAVNGSVVPRAAWSTQALADADSVLVIRATQGG